MFEYHPDDQPINYLIPMDMNKEKYIDLITNLLSDENFKFSELRPIVALGVTNAIMKHYKKADSERHELYIYAAAGAKSEVKKYKKTRLNLIG